MQITKQLTIFLNNRPGVLARLAKMVSEAEVNILAISTSDTIDHSVVHMVVSNHRKGVQACKKHGITAIEHDVLVVVGEHSPGALARIAHRLADAKINIEYCYSATGLKEKRGLMVLRLSDAKKAMKVLSS